MPKERRGIIAVFEQLRKRGQVTAGIFLVAPSCPGRLRVES
jgi:hypothetical protein